MITYIYAVSKPAFKMCSFVTRYYLVTKAQQVEALFVLYPCLMLLCSKSASLAPAVFEPLWSPLTEHWHVQIPLLGELYIVICHTRMLDLLCATCA